LLRLSTKEYLIFS